MEREAASVFPVTVWAPEDPSSSPDSLAQRAQTDQESGDVSRAPSSSEENGESARAAPRKRQRKPRKATNTMRRVRT